VAIKTSFGVYPLTTATTPRTLIATRRPPSPIIKSTV
jgi:hypothetical protein